MPEYSPCARCKFHPHEWGLPDQVPRIHLGAVVSSPRVGIARTCQRWTIRCSGFIPTSGDCPQLFDCAGALLWFHPHEWGLSCVAVEQADRSFCFFPTHGDCPRSSEAERSADLFLPHSRGLSGTVQQSDYLLVVSSPLTGIVR